MKKHESPEIPMKPEVSTESCAHHWVKTHTAHGKALKCEFCGKVIDSHD